LIADYAAIRLVTLSLSDIASLLSDAISQIVIIDIVVISLAGRLSSVVIGHFAMIGFHCMHSRFSPLIFADATLISLRHASYRHFHARH